MDLKAFCNTKTPAEIKDIVDRAYIFVFAIEFVFNVAIYVLLKHYASIFWAEAWMTIIYAWTLKSSIDMSKPIMIDKLTKNDKKHELEKEDTKNTPKEDT